jgi:hypothetical protein
MAVALLLRDEAHATGARAQSHAARLRRAADGRIGGVGDGGYLDLTGLWRGRAGEWLGPVE